MDRDEWLRAYCERIGAEPPTAAEAEALLALAGVAAHASERPAAPLACWVAGRSGRPLEQLLEAARGAS